VWWWATLIVRVDLFHRHCEFDSSSAAELPQYQVSWIGQRPLIYHETQKLPNVNALVMTASMEH